MAAFPSHIQRDNIVKQARFGIAVDRWMAKNECDASSNPVLDLDAG